MQPKKPISNRELKRELNNLNAESYTTKEDLAKIKEDAKKLKAFKVIETFKQTTKTNFLDLSAVESNTMLYKLLKALCFSEDNE